jgi:O-antigen ligase
LKTPRGKIDIAKALFAFSVYCFAFSAPVSIAAVQAAAFLIIILGVPMMLMGGRIDAVPLPAAISLSVFLLLILVSAVLSTSLPASASQLKKSWVMFCLFPLTALSPLYSGRRSIDLLIIGTTLASILALFRFFSGDVDRAAPYSGGYTTLALFEAAVIPFAMALSAKTRSGIRYLYVISTIIMAAGLVFTMTRAGWIAGIVGIIIVGFGLSKKRTIAGIVLAVVLLAIITPTRDMITNRFATARSGGVTSGRLSLYTAASGPLTGLPLFGYGPGSFSSLVSIEVLEEIGDTGIRSWHSTLLEVLMESGPVALAIFIVLAMLPLRNLIYRRIVLRDNSYLLSAVFACIVVLYIAGLTTNLLRDFMILSLLTLVWSVSRTDWPATE